MSIKDWDNGTRVVRLGQGTTTISNIFVEDSQVASGLCFAPLGFTGELKGQEVIIEITNASGVVSYIKAIADLLRTWDISGDNESEIAEVSRQLNELHKQLYSLG
ncbi:hypothetical protein NDS46_31485 (plasmid) [Paenibacillus thiaminolyticus]|uniref:hypothetical protein n=1 Tax=Paenibacillus thiaminolyticus TaxID=49283 RepID=UPI00232B31FE|nr:hypothetical protein [Paenibacillus thiaminolyticus]WCF11481.1 hypothetical protein NDS46_31485 [Paenibacillus thiaminolyticus]